MGKGEIAPKKKFLLFPQCFQKISNESRACFGLFPNDNILGDTRLNAFADGKLHLFLAPLAERPAIYCRDVVFVGCPFVSPFVRPYSLPSKNFCSKTIDWIFTKFHRNVPYVVLFQIPSNKFVLCKILVYMAIKVKKKTLKIFSSQTTNWIALLFCRNVP